MNKPLKALLTSAAVILTTACSPVKTLNALVPDSGYQRQSNIAYGDLPRQTLDIYLPKTSADAKPMPVVIFFYGGSWDSGEKANYKFVGEALSSQGYITVIPDYRIYPDVLFPGFMEDPAHAAAWVKQHIAAYGGDAQHVFLGGHSAGAHIAVMLSVNPQYLATVQLTPTDFSGTFGLAGPYDFLPLKSERLKTIFGPEEERWKSQPISFADGHNPPMLLLVGKKDGTVWPRNTYNLAQKIKAHGGPVQVAEFPNYGHVDMAAKLAKPLRDPELLGAITQFLATTPAVTPTNTTMR